MSSIEIKKISITELDTDAIVNAANEGLWAGGGVCGAIFAAAGHDELQSACNRIGHCDTGAAVITPGFNLKAKYIIHAVGPVWQNGRNKEPELLYSAYYKALELAKENHCSSIGFPLISAGIFGYPLVGAWEQALAACRDFLDQLKDDSIDIIFAVLDDRILNEGVKQLHGSGALEDKIAERTDRKTESMADKLTISGTEYDAVFFHKPDEPNGYLSNWFLSPFELDELHFSSVEQYIMYRKCKLFGDDRSAKEVLDTDDVATQQAIGRKAVGYNDSVWAGARQMVAFRGLMAKFSQNADLKQKLLDTGNSFLVECAGSDKIWACGVRLNDDRRFDANNWTGQNILGFTLMEVRKILAGK